MIEYENGPEPVMHVIVGPNASGKTRYLRNLLSRLDNVITNLDCVEDSESRKYNLDRLELLADYLIADAVVEKDGVVTIVNGYVPYSEEFKTEALKLCREGDYLVLDEPDMLMEEIAGNMLYAFMRTLIPTFKSCYVVTYRQCLIAEDFCISYKIGKDGNLVQIGDREAFGYVN